MRKMSKKEKKRRKLAAVNGSLGKEKKKGNRHRPNHNRDKRRGRKVLHSLQVRSKGGKKEGKFLGTIFTSAKGKEGKAALYTLPTKGGKRGGKKRKGKKYFPRRVAARRMSKRKRADPSDSSPATP